MTQVTAVTRCAVLNHYHVTVSDGVKTVELVFDKDELVDDAREFSREERVRDRVKPLVRDAKGAGNTTFLQIRAYT